LIDIIYLQLLHSILNHSGIKQDNLGFAQRIQESLFE